MSQLEAKPSGWERIKEAFRRNWQAAKAGELKTGHRAMGQADGDAIKEAQWEGPGPH
jgi:hypothetical protein